MKLFLILIILFLAANICCAQSNIDMNEYIIQEKNYNSVNNSNFFERFSFDLSSKKKQNKKFGEDMYNSVREFEDNLNDAFKNIVIPNFVPEFMRANLDLKINYKKDFVFSLTYKHRY